METLKKQLLVAACVSVALVLVMSAFGCVQATSDNCKGSGYCGRVNPNDCRTAINRYTNQHVYSQYTSRVAGHCTAIYHCRGFYPSLRGSELKQLFLHVYNNQPCKKCGSHSFYGGNCEATLNYCGNCRDSGDPHSEAEYE